MIAFGTQNFDTAERSQFWKYILAGEYNIDMVNMAGDVIGIEVVIMSDQKKAADIADFAKDIAVYDEQETGLWKRRKPKNNRA